MYSAFSQLLGLFLQNWGWSWNLMKLYFEIPCSYHFSTQYTKRSCKFLLSQCLIMSCPVEHGFGSQKVKWRKACIWQHLKTKVVISRAVCSRSSKNLLLFKLNYLYSLQELCWYLWGFKTVLFCCDFICIVQRCACHFCLYSFTYFFFLQFHTASLPSKSSWIFRMELPVHSRI